MNFGTEKIDQAEARSEELQQFFHELSLTTGFRILDGDKPIYTIQQFLDLSFFHGGDLKKPRKITKPMMDGVDPHDSFLLRKKVGSVSDPLNFLLREVASAYSRGSLETRSQSIYCFLNSILGKTRR